MSRTLWIVLCGGVVISCGAPANHDPSPRGSSPPAAAGPAIAGAARGPETGPRMPVTSAHHHPIRTTSQEAQAWFDQGMTLVFAFNHDEAIRAFERAAALDPASPMPHWGVAWALGPNYNLDIDDPRSRRATDAVLRARRLAESGPDVERAYVETLAGRYSPDPSADRTALARRYAVSMRDLSRRFPDDLDAATLYAESLMNLQPWRLWGLDGTPAAGTREIVGVLESVLQRDPNHVGANHYYIHAVEASPSPALALPSAHRLATLVPEAGHLVHMPAHVHARTGDHAAAARANEAGVEADRAYLKTAPPGGFYAMAYYPHNLHFLADSHMMQGRFADARRAALALADALAPHLDMMPMAESMVTTATSVLLRFGRHAEILAEPAPDPSRPVLTAWWHFARGVALARSGRPDEAATERAALEAAIRRVPAEALFGGTGLTPARDLLQLAALVLEARLAEARDGPRAALPTWRRAVAVGDSVPYDEPPIWFYPLRESLGGALLRAGDPVGAERAFRDDLVRHPRNARALAGLRESLARQERDTGWVQRALDAAWTAPEPPPSAEAL